MDWSAIYEETGDEDGDWGGFVSRITPVLESYQIAGKYNSIICYFFTINYILGVGCLGVPYAFFKSGTILGTILIIGLSLVAYMTVMWVAEAGHRDLELRRLDSKGIITPMTRGRANSLNYQVSHARQSSIRERANSLTNRVALISGDSSQSNNEESPLTEYNRLQRVDTRNAAKNYGSGSTTTTNNNNNNSNSSMKKNFKQEDVFELTSLSFLIEKEDLYLKNRESRESRESGSLSPVYQSSSPRSRSRNRLLSDDMLSLDAADGEAEVVELVLRFLGPVSKSCYQVSIMLLMSVGLIAYTQVFVHTFLQQIWSSAPNYIPVLLFACIVVPLSCVDLAEQINVQVAMSILRILTLSILVVGTLVAVCIDSGDSGYRNDNTDSVTYRNDHIPLCDITGFSLMFTTAIFSQLFQHSVPGLIRPLPPHEKRNISYIFLGALCTTGVFYVVIGCACVYYFGPKINQAINLNFVDFYWGIKYTSDFWGTLQMILVRFLSMTVVLFPALDTLSVFPLIANTLGNNLNVSFPSSWKNMHSVVNHCSSKSKSESKKIMKQCWRLVAALPPIIWSMFVTDLSLTLQFAGLCGIVVALITPALLQYYSVIQVEESIEAINKMNFDDEQNINFTTVTAITPYSGAFSNVKFTFFVLVLAVLALVTCIYQMFESSSI